MTLFYLGFLPWKSLTVIRGRAGSLWDEIVGFEVRIFDLGFWVSITGATQEVLDWTCSHRRSYARLEPSIHTEKSPFMRLRIGLSGYDPSTSHVRIKGVTRKLQWIAWHIFHATGTYEIKSQSSEDICLWLRCLEVDCR